MFVFLIAAGLLIVIGIGVISYINKQSKIQNIIIPSHLGRNTKIPLKKAIKALENGLDSHFEQRIKERFQMEHKKVKDHEFQLLLFELKRFFVMCSLLKTVPMFSDKVDNVWHTMLMFTKEYNEFSHTLCGHFIHHVPVEKRVSQPDERAWFDLIYTQLFECTPYSPMAWGRFFRYPLNQNQLRELRFSSVPELKKKYFRDDADDSIIQALIEQLKVKIEDSLLQKGYKIKPKYYHDIVSYAPYLAGAMIFYSLNHPGDYKKYMMPVQSSNSSNSTGSCSSCCNCGSSCGSSCGGGCGSC